MHPAAWSLCDSWATCNLMQNLCSLKLNFKHFWDNKCCGYYKLSNFYSDRDISSFCGNVCAQRMWVNNAVWRGVLQVAISRFEPDHYLPYQQLQRNLETVRRRYSQCLCVCVCVWSYGPTKTWLPQSENTEQFGPSRSRRVQDPVPSRPRIEWTVESLYHSLSGTDPLSAPPVDAHHRCRLTLSTVGGPQ